MILRDIENIMESWAPLKTAWDRDNTGLQVGAHTDRITRILITLDVTEEVISEARRSGADLIISHHPLIFHPLKGATAESRTGRLVLELARHRIALYVAHTNLDYAETGVSHALAQRLGLQQPGILSPARGDLRKIAVFVPESHASRVLEAMASAGAGHIGRYDHCAFQIAGEGSFRPLEGSRPFIGRRNSIERVREQRIEMIVPFWLVDRVVAEMKRAHVYEEVAYDIYRLENQHATVGAGIIGNLPRPMPFDAFVKFVRTRLKIPCVRAARGKPGKISTVAVCGGSGSEYLPDAIGRGADAYVTADVKYHTFQDAEGTIALLDAGHYETEMPVLHHIAERLRSTASPGGRRPAITISRRVHNPVTYHSS